MKLNYVLFATSVSILLFVVLYYIADKPIMELKSANIKNGVLELGLKKDVKFKLDGEWEVVNDRLLMADEFVNVAGTYQNLPYIWNYDGVATYKLTIKSDVDLFNLAVKAPIAFSAYELYFNGQLIAYNGYPSEDENLEVIERKNIITPLKINRGDNTFILRVSNHSLYRGGISKSIVIMDRQTLEKYESNIRTIDTIFAGGYLFVFIYFTIIHFIKPDMSIFLYFGLGSFGLFLKTIVTNSMIINNIFMNFNWEIGNRIDSAFTLVFIPLIILMILSIFSDTFDSKYTQTFKWIAIINLLCIVIFPHKVYETLIIPVLLILFSFSFYIVYMIFKNLKYYYQEIALFLVGVIVVIVFSVSDVLNYILLSNYIYRTHYSVFILSLFMLILVMIRIDNALKYKGSEV